MGRRHSASRGRLDVHRRARPTALPFAGLNDDELVRHKGELIYPNFMLSLSAEHVAAFTAAARGPDRTTIVCDFLFHPDEMAKPDFDPSDAVDFWDLVNRQDWAICESVQRGMQSRVFQSRLLRTDGEREPRHSPLHRRRRISLPLDPAAGERRR